MHNPVRSERDVFRAVVIIGIGAAAVIALTLLTRPAVGAALLAAEVGLGVGLLWRGAQGTLRQPAEVARREDPTYRVLVLANETVGGRALLAEIQNRCKGRSSEILVVVPALTSSRVEHWASDVDGALAEARRRLDESLRTMAAAGIKASGTVGDHHEPNASLEDALRTFPADEVIISTHPPERSRWLERGVVERAREEVPLPITHVVVDLEAEARAAAGAAGAPA
jgi:GABA permease